MQRYIHQHLSRRGALAVLFPACCCLCSSRVLIVALQSSVALGCALEAAWSRIAWVSALLAGMSSLHEVICAWDLPPDTVQKIETWLSHPDRGCNLAEPPDEVFYTIGEQDLFKAGLATVKERRSVLAKLRPAVGKHCTCFPHQEAPTSNCRWATCLCQILAKNSAFVEVHLVLHSRHPVGAWVSAVDSSLQPAVAQHASCCCNSVRSRNRVVV